MTLHHTPASIAFKEWSLICNALIDGRQSIILRKGGIAEDKGEFAFKYNSFFLLPTHYHLQRERTRFVLQEPIQWQQEGMIFLPALATIDFVRVLSDWDRVFELEPFHFWTEETIWDRFRYDCVRRIHLAVVRVWRVEPVLQLPTSNELGGCRSWVELPKLPSFSQTTVLSDEEHTKRIQQIEEVLS